jgi:hypothetical protein
MSPAPRLDSPMVRHQVDDALADHRPQAGAADIVVELGLCERAEQVADVVLAIRSVSRTSKRNSCWSWSRPSVTAT